MLTRDNDSGEIRMNSYFKSLPPHQAIRAYQNFEYPMDAIEELAKASSDFGKHAKPLQVPLLRGHAMRTGGHHNLSDSRLMPTPRRLRSRQLVTLSPTCLGETPNRQASILVHETDHALFSIEFTDDPLPVFDTSSDALVTMMERSAYRTSYIILNHTGELDGLSTLDDIAAAPTMDEKADLLDSLPDTVGSSVAAVALTSLCGKNSGVPQPIEVELYKIAGLI